jgi:Abnormal spindle-like microcephaly-assoc'd, ASPM-SPD-2-Hydin
MPTGTTCPLGAGMLAGNMSCTVAITFTPGATGARSATLNIAGSDLPGSPKMVALSGTGTPPPAPAVTLVPTGLTFGVIPVGQNSTQSVTLTNSGNAGLTITSIAISGPNAGDFSQTNNCPVAAAAGPLAAGGMCTIMVTFTPSAIQPESATLTITDNAANSPQTVALAGGGPGFTLMVPPSSSGGSGSTITVLPGDTATYTLMLVCSPGVTGTITLMGMQPLPPNTILTVTPMMITCPAAGPVTVTVMLQTNCVARLVGPRPWNGWPSGSPLAPLGLPIEARLGGLLAALLLLAMGGKLMTQRETAGAVRLARQGGLAPALVLLVAVALPLCLAGCGVNNLPPALPNQPTTPAGTYPITIVGTGPTGAKVTLTLTVKVI